MAFLRVLCAYLSALCVQLRFSGLNAKDASRSNHNLRSVRDQRTPLNPILETISRRGLQRFRVCI